MKSLRTEPTELQLRRVYELLGDTDIPDEYLETLNVQKVTVLLASTRGTGVLISMLKKKKAEKENGAHQAA